MGYVTAAGESFGAERFVPMAGGVNAAVQGAAGIVIFDLQMIAAGLVEIDRVGEVGFLRFGDLVDAIFSRELPKQSNKKRFWSQVGSLVSQRYSNKLN